MTKKQIADLLASLPEGFPDDAQVPIPGTLLIEFVPPYCTNMRFTPPYQPAAMNLALDMAKGQLIAKVAQDMNAAQQLAVAQHKQGNGLAKPPDGFKAARNPRA
jgi:hypothetical protein